MTKISTAFQNATLTENGDLAFKSTGNKMVDLLFYAPYLTENPQYIADLAKEVDENILGLFACFMRDPRLGMGWKVVGRELLKIAGVDPAGIVAVGRYDDLWRIGGPANIEYLKQQVIANNALAKKWCPRFGSKNKVDASILAKLWGMNKQTYGKFIKVETVEKMLTDKNTDSIKFEQVPSLAALKYANRFLHGEDTRERYCAYKESVKKGEADLKVTVTNPYDIYKHREVIDCDMFFNKMMEQKKISLSCMPIVDTSSSMLSGDAFGKALAIGHYLSLCSTYETGKVVSFSSKPQVIDIFGTDEVKTEDWYGGYKPKENGSEYMKQIARMYTGDCSNTDLGKVMELLKHVDELPEYLVVLSDQQFDMGSNRSKEQLKELWKAKGYTTKIVWWNFNGRGMNTPETDEMGNIFMSGFNPTMLQYLESGFDAETFITKMLSEYALKLEAAQENA